MPVTERIAGRPAGAVPEQSWNRDVDPEQALVRVLRDLRTRPEGLTQREAERRLEVVGRNELVRRARSSWARRLLDQLVHPLALLLWVAALLAELNGTAPLAVAIVAVILLNAAFAVLQEHHAERAVEALAQYLPRHARVFRDGESRLVETTSLVPGDVVVVGEGDGVSADTRIISGAMEVDVSTLTGESLPVVRSAEGTGGQGRLLDAEDILFSGTTCTEGECHGVVFATGMHTELGRIAALSQRVRHEPSPLERQVSRVARLIALVALIMGAAFIPLGTLFAGLSLADTVNFAIGLLVANVPEGMLPTITLALAVGVRLLAREGALVKRISAVETLGSTDVICTDKTGTLTMNQMRVVRAWTSSGVDHVGEPPDFGEGAATEGASSGPVLNRMVGAVVMCNNARLLDDAGTEAEGDPTEIALLRMAVGLELPHTPAGDLVAVLPFDPRLRRMTTVRQLGHHMVASSKGAPEAILPRCTRVAGRDRDIPLDDDVRRDIAGTVESWASEGLRLLAVAERSAVTWETTDRDVVEQDLTLLGIVAMVDPPRPEVREAVAHCHSAGIRLLIVTGDHGLTAKGIARRVGIGDDATPVLLGDDLDGMSEADLDILLERNRELVFARSSPETKLRVADALRAHGHVVAMTGDGVNDAPALRRADIGVAMGRSGTEVAREAATMVLTDDNFATIVSAVKAGRQVYDNVRKFIVYIFAHATPEVVPFLLYALSGGRIPLPLTVMQILAIDLGTETLPALALGREPGEPGLMDRAPRRRGANVIDSPMLMRAWLLLGGMSAILVTALFLLTLVAGGWTPGSDLAGPGGNHLWHQATTMTFLGIVACQVGTAFAARTEHASLREVGLWTNPLLLWGIAFELVFAVAIVVVPWCREIFGTAVPEAWQWLALLPLPFVVWAVDECFRWVRRRSDRHPLGAGREFGGALFGNP